MIFAKNFSCVNYNDVEALLKNKIPESDILDYKQQFPDENDFLKHICAFANTRGGIIIVGVTESGKGGYPVQINGIDSSGINKERIEQIVLSNILPRLNIRFHTIQHTDPDKSLLLVQIPQSQYKPHFNSRSKKFYKRFQFEAAEMTEQEISDAYKKRFSTLVDVENYIEKLNKYDYGKSVIRGNLIIIPSIIERRIIDTSDNSDFSWLNPDLIDPQPSGWVWAPRNGYLPNFPKPFAHGIICKQETQAYFPKAVRLHRNGCIQYVQDFGIHTGSKDLIYKKLALKLLHTLQFAHTVFSKYNYFGDVRIHLNISCDGGCVLALPKSFDSSRGFATGDSEIVIDREFSISELENNYSMIAGSIMDEVFNHFGLWRCHLFDKSGAYIKTEFDKD